MVLIFTHCSSLFLSHPTLTRLHCRGGRCWPCKTSSHLTTNSAHCSPASCLCNRPWRLDNRFDWHADGAVLPPTALPVLDDLPRGFTVGVCRGQWSRRVVSSLCAHHGCIYSIPLPFMHINLLWSHFYLVFPLFSPELLNYVYNQHPKCITIHYMQDANITLGYAVNVCCMQNPSQLQSLVLVHCMMCLNTSFITWQ